MSDEPVKYTVKQAAHYLGVSKGWLDKARCDETGPVFHKVGRRIIYHKTDLDTFMAERRCTKTSGERKGKRTGKRKNPGAER